MCGERQAHRGHGGHLSRTPCVDFLPARGAVPFLFPGCDGRHLHSASAERGPPRSETSPAEGASFGAHASTPRLPSPSAASGAAPAASSRVTSCAPARVPVIGPKRLRDIRALHESPRVQLGTRMAAGVFRGSCGVDRDNRASNSRPSFPRPEGAATVFCKDWTASSTSRGSSLRPLHGALPKMPSSSAPAASPRVVHTAIRACFQRPIPLPDLWSAMRSSGSGRAGPTIPPQAAGAWINPNAVRRLLRIEIGRIVRKAEECAALPACSSKAGGPVAKARPRVAAAVAAATPATASGWLRTIP